MTLIAAAARSTLVFGGSCAAALATAASAAVINVPGDQPTIQAAIDASTNGDEIVVAPGTYHEAIQFLGKAITLRSASGPEVTRIDATGLATSTVRFVAGEGPAALLDGFSISGGAGVVAPGEVYPGGGGIMVDAASPTIIHCVILLNNAVLGGGFRARGNCHPSFSDCLIMANNGSTGGGGRLDGSTVNVTRCHFIGNTASAIGGGVLSSSGHLIAEDCSFSGNSGGGIAATLSILTLRRCLLAANTGGVEGGGVWFAGTAEMTGCVIAENSATNGGGLTIGEGSLTLRNCSIARNAGNGLHSLNESTPVTAANCVFWENQPGEIDVARQAMVAVFSSNVQGGWTGDGANNIDADPQFATGPVGSWTQAPSFDPSTTLTTLTDAGASYEPGALIGQVIVPTTAFGLKTAVVANTATTITLVGQIWSLLVASGADYQLSDYHLQLGSPCIDAGDNALAAPETLDLEGNPRFVGVLEAPNTGQGDCPLVDMGAYEFQGGTPECPPCPADCAAPADGSVDIVDFLALLGAWGTPGPCDLDGSGSIDIVDFLELLGTWGACP